ncbi:MAG: ribbon-helix-helix domain-containing protein [Nanoarchaeota archaeon]|nr:ribbon-helix-helix domain-containing protein [Nanoarchaeota archaeon]
MVTKYTNVGLPDDLIKQIDMVIKNSKLGYKSRGEFVKESVRKSLKELIKLKIN